MKFPKELYVKLDDEEDRIFSASDDVTLLLLDEGTSDVKLGVYKLEQVISASLQPVITTK